MVFLAMQRTVVAAVVTLAVVVVQADIYPDGACPIFVLLPFTTRYVKMAM